MWQQFNSPILFQDFLSSNRLFWYIRDENIEVLFAALNITLNNITALSNSAYKHTMKTLHNNRSLLNYLPLVANVVELSRIEFDKLLMNLKTSSYVDMMIFLNHITLNWTCIFYYRIICVLYIYNLLISNFFMFFLSFLL
jgi:hypothetical protein